MLKTVIHRGMLNIMSIVLMLSALPIMAQEDEVIEKSLTIVEGSHLTFSAKMGYSNLMVNSESFKNSKGGFGLGFELDYTHFVSDHVGLRLGCDIALHLSKYQMASYTAQSSEKIHVGTNPLQNESQVVDAVYNTTTSDIVADYAYSAVGIPVALAFQGEYWYANAGVKFNIPLKLTEEYSYGESQAECVSVGYNPQDPPIPSGTLAAQSKKRYTSYNASARGNTFKPFFITSLIEAGFRIGSPRGDALEIGVYAEFAFNECHPNHAEPLVARVDGNIESRSTLMSNAVKSLRLFDVGLKMSYDLSFRHPRRK